MILFHRYFYFILLLLFVSSLELAAKSIRLRTIIRDEPATTLAIGWDQISGSEAVVCYGETDFGTQADRYPSRAFPQRIVYAKGMNNHFARLVRLKPNTVYYFVIRDSEGNSQRYSFCTAPDDHNSRLSILAGGDSRNLATARQNANKLVAKLRPHFVMFDGDMTGGDTDREWREWFDDWQLTIGRDGRITPIVPARGNHEFKNQSIVDMFDVNHPDVYYGLTFARGLLRVYTLNSLMPSSGEQRNWLEQDLRENQGVAWRFAQYHHPMRPHTKRKAENEYLRRYWAPLFEQYKMHLALECDSHVFKVTWPIVSSNAAGNDEGFVRDDQNGVVYIGEGGWGAPLREDNDRKSWTRAAGSINQIKWIFIDLGTIEVRTILTDNANAVASLSDEQRFSMPVGIQLYRMENNDHFALYNKNKHLFRPESKQSLIELQSALAKNQNNAIQIEWACSFEEEGTQFKIQQSTNKVFWKTLATLKGKGGASERLNYYSFADNSNPQGSKVYYRIVAVDRAGSELVKEELELRLLSSYNNMETIEVNANIGRIDIPIELSSKNWVLVEIFDINRQLVFVQKVELKAGEHTLPLNVRHLKAGNYLLEISYEQQLLRRSVRVIKPNN